MYYEAKNKKSKQTYRSV